MDIKETLHEAGQSIAEGAKGLKDKLVAKLSEENEQSPEQRLKNAIAESEGAKAAEAAAKRALQAAQDEAEKLKAYIASATEKGDSAKARRFEDAMQEIADKLPTLQDAYQAAVAKTQALGEIVKEFADALKGDAETSEADITLEPETEEASDMEPEVAAEEATFEEIPETEGE